MKLNVTQSAHLRPGPKAKHVFFKAIAWREQFFICLRPSSLSKYVLLNNAAVLSLCSLAPPEHLRKHHI